MKKRPGRSYAKRVADVNQIYDQYVRTGLSNREIWRRYVYPKYGITEQTFYNLLKASSRCDLEDRKELLSEGFLFPDDISRQDALSHPDFFKKSK